MIMKATQLYEHLEKDFITSEMSDEWAPYMDSISDFLSENFQKRSMGLVCDFATEINNVYTAVFPSREVMQRIDPLKNNSRKQTNFACFPGIFFFQLKSDKVSQSGDILENQIV